MSRESVVRLVVSYVEEHLFEEITIDKIAGELNYSKFYIARVFREHTGGTIYKYIQSRRLTEAARMLVETDMPIVEIAYEVNYSSQQAFTQAFHQVYLCTPQAYRKNRLFYPVQTQLVIQRMDGFMQSESRMLTKKATGFICNGTLHEIGVTMQKGGRAA